MKRAILMLGAALTAGAQTIPGRYIVEFQTEPAARVSAAKKARFSAKDVDVAARRAQIQAEHASAIDAIHSLGGTIVGRYDTAFNGLAVKIQDSAVAQLKALPGVTAVVPDKKHKPALDHAVIVHRITDVWAALPGGQASAGAGIMIGMLDIGIDGAHPGFQGFTTPIPTGFPIGCDYGVDAMGDLTTCVSSPAELANTNNKLIVSRDYTGTGGVDVDGHGTGTSMIAAGVTNQATYDYYLTDGTILPIPIAPITGVAPGAWLGDYKVCSDASGCLDSWFLQALDDAMTDGMSVVNYSVGGPDTNYESETTDPDTQAIAAAVAGGVVVVVSAGDDGYNPNGGQSASTIEEPAVAPAAIAVGAMANSREFNYGVNVQGMPPVLAATPDLTNDVNFDDINDPVTGPMTDVATIDGTGYACAALPAGSLSGQIALIVRGGRPTACTFDSKLNNAQNAGAIAAVVYDDKPVVPLVDMELTTATLPGMFVSQSDGLNIKGQIASNPGVQATLDFSGLTQFSISPSILASYSPAGPTPSGNIKPDVVAVGGYGITPDEGLDCIVTADATINEPDPYQIYSCGTSFSAPLVTGSIAVLMAARPGLTAQQYQSLIINSAPGLLICDDGSFPASNLCDDGTSPIAALIQTAGTGQMDLLDAMSVELAASPTSLNFQTATGSSVAATIPLVMTNVSGVTDTFTVAVNPVDPTLVPSVDTPTFNLAPGASQTIHVSMAGSNLQPGTLNDGYVVVTGTQTSAATSVAYWFGVPGTSVQSISLLDQNYINGGFGSREEVPLYVRYVDAIGLPIAGAAPTVANTAGGGTARVLDVIPLGDVPGTFEIDVRTDNGAALDGYDEFTVSIGSVSLVVYIPIND